MTRYVANLGGGIYALKDHNRDDDQSLSIVQLDDYGRIDNIFTPDEFRNCGYARELLEANKRGS